MLANGYLPCFRIGLPSLSIRVFQEGLFTGGIAPSPQNGAAQNGTGGRLSKHILKHALRAPATRRNINAHLLIQISR